MQVKIYIALLQEKMDQMRSPRQSIYRPMLNVIMKHRPNYDDVVVDDNDDNYGKNVVTDVDDDDDDNGDDDDDDDEAFIVNLLALTS